MKRENLFLMIAAIAMLFGATLLIVLQYFFVPTSPIDQMFNQRVWLTEEVVVTDGPSTILTHQEILNIRNQKLGDLYTTTKTGFTDPALAEDNIDLYVAITTDEKVYVIDRTINQTAEYIPFLRDYILSNYRGISYQDVGSVDGAAGATTAFISRATIQAMIQDVVNYHFNLVPEEHPYKAWFGENFTGVIATQENLSDVVLKKETINDNLGYVYTARAEGEYRQDRFASITLVLAIDSNGIILGGDLPEEDDQYGHTSGFRGSALAYIADHLVGRSINDLPDATGGATYTATLINDMIGQIALIFNSELTEVERWFGPGATIVSEEEITHDVVNLKQTISNDKGFIFTARAEGEYRTGRLGTITLVLAISNKGIILGGDLPDNDDLYGHTPSFRDNALAYIADHLVGRSINDLPDATGGSTYTAALINDMIGQIASIHVVELTQVEQWFGVDATIVAEEEVLDDIVNLKQTVSDNKGFIFTARAEGEYRTGRFGTITLVLAISNKGIILGGDLPDNDGLYGHTANYRDNALAYIADHLVGRSINDLPDATGGSTFTASLINDMIGQIAIIHVVELTQVEQWFGVDATIVAEEEVLDDIVNLKQTVSDNKGFIFTARAEGEYRTGRFGTITLVLAINSDGIILGGDLPDNDGLYGHTANYRDNALAYIAEHLVGRNINDLPDATGGSTFTASLINDMIGKIAEIHANSLTLVGQWFNAAATVVSEEVISDDIVSLKQTVSNGLGYIYTATLNGQYRDNGAEGEITLILAINAQGVILGGDLPADLYNHTANRRVTLLNYINESLVGQNINDMPDVSTSNTLTKTVIDNMISQIAEVHQ